MARVIINDSGEQELFTDANPGVVELAAGAVTIGTVTLGAGTASVGKLGANSGVDIGDVDVASVPGALQGPGNPTVDSYTCAAVNLAASTADQV